jgi:regulatory protein
MPGDGDELQRALELAYRYLNRRERTETEVQARLEQAGISAPVTQEALDELRGHGVVDDQRFARLFVEDKRSLGQWGADRIRRTLLARGLDRDLIEHALDGDGDGDGGEGELERALELLRSRFPEPPRDRRERDRALGVMLRKGYDSEIAVDALAAHARDDRAQ